MAKVRKKKKPKRVKVTRDSKLVKQHLRDEGLDIPIFGIKRIKFGGPRRVTKEAEEAFLSNAEGQRGLIRKKAPARKLA